MKKIKKKNYKKIGILGGTFDPPHIGHLNISNLGLKKFKLDKIIWLITKKNPLKDKPYLSIKVRIKLSKYINRNQKKTVIKHLDEVIKATDTFSLLSYFKKKNKKAELFFLLGADNFVNLHKWKNWQKIVQLAKIVVFARPGYSAKALNSIASKKLEKKDWIYINNSKLNISSSLIRKL